MCFFLSNIFIQWGVPFLVGMIAALSCKLYFLLHIKNKIKGYQSDIIKSHTRILELDDKNEELQKRIKELESPFSKDRIFMN